MSLTAPKRILFLNRVFPPAAGATGQLLSELAPALATEGFDVTILTTGTRFNDSTIQRFNDSTITVERIPSLPLNRSSFWTRALSYLALYPAFLWRALRLPRFDFIVTMTDPPLLLLLGPIVALFKGSQLIHWAQDIYPELAEELGVLRPRSWLANFLRRLSTWALSKQIKVIAIGRCMKKRLLARGLRESDIEIIPNWASTSLSTHPRPSSSVLDLVASASPKEDEREFDTVFRTRHRLQQTFIAMYSGNFGLAHSFDEIIEAAQALAPKRPEILFVMVGDGPRLAALQQRVAELSLPNIRFLPSQPADQLSSVLGAANIHLVTMLRQTNGLVVPSKIYGILAAGRPCLFVGPRQSEVALLLEEFQSGKTVSSGSELASALLEFADHPQQLSAAADCAKSAAVGFTLKVATSAFSSLFRDLATPADFPEAHPDSRAAA